MRDSTGAITTVYDRFSNIAKVQVEGIDADMRWRLPSASTYGKLTLRMGGSYLASFQQPPAIGAAMTEYAGNNAGPRGALPRTKGKVGFDWDVAGFLLTVNGNVTSGYNQKRGVAFTSVQTHVPSQTTADIYLAYNGFKNLKVSLAVSNVEDKQPPFDAGTFGWDPTQYDLRGRYVRGGIEYKFR